MAATVTQAVATPSTSNTSTYASGSFTPVAGDLLLVFVAASGQTTAGTLSSSAGTTFTSLGTVLKNTSADLMQVFVANAVSAATAQTVTFTTGSGNATGCNIHVMRVAGLDQVGSAAVRQQATAANQAASGTPTTTFSQTTLTGSPIISFMANSTNAPALTASTGFTAQTGIGYNTPASGSQTEFDNSGNTITSLAWGSTSATAYGVFAVEINASINVGLTEAASASDSSAGNLVTTAEVTEAGSASDAPSSTLTTSAVVTEAGSATDSSTATSSTTQTGSVTEAGSASETSSGSLSFSTTVSEAASASEVLVATASFLGTSAEAATATDVASASAVFVATVNEAGSANDAPTATMVAPVSVTEAGSASDSTSASATFTAVVTEAAIATDTVSQGGSASGSVTEAASAADASSASLSMSSSVTESGTAVDQSTANKVAVASVTESANATDSSSATSVLMAVISEVASAGETVAAAVVWVVSTIASAIATMVTDAVISARLHGGDKRWVTTAKARNTETTANGRTTISDNAVRITEAAKRNGNTIK